MSSRQAKQVWVGRRQLFQPVHQGLGVDVPRRRQRLQGLDRPQDIGGNDRHDAGESLLIGQLYESAARAGRQLLIGATAVPSAAEMEGVDAGSAFLQPVRNAEHVRKIVVEAVAEDDDPVDRIALVCAIGQGLGIARFALEAVPARRAVAGVDR